MEISKVSINQINPNKQIKFKGASAWEKSIYNQDAKLSKRSEKLMKALDDLIERTWSGIKKGEISQSSPIYFSKIGKSSIVIKPVYTQDFPAVLFEINEGKYTHRILLNRKKPSDFKYEKIVETDFGSATLKSHNSRYSDDKDLNTFVDNIILNSVPKQLPGRIYMEHLNAERFRNTFDII